MGRKAKDAAQKKIGEWTGARRDVSKVEKAPKTTTKPKPAATLATTKTNENANTSDENRSPLQTFSPSELNAMKNCTVILEKFENPSDQAPQPKRPQRNALAAKKLPAPAKISAPAAAHADIVPQKQTDTQKVYDYSFDDDSDEAMSLQTDQDDVMKDLFDKMARENKIVVKKYRPKNVKKQKANADDKDKPAKKATATRKRPRDKQVTSAGQQPPQKRPNLKSKKVTNTDADSGDVAVDNGRKLDVGPANNRIGDGNGISPGKKVTILEDILIKPNEMITLKRIAKQTDRVDLQPRLRNQLMKNFQSTPKSSTPLSTKTATAINTKDRSLNSLFENVSPLNNNLSKPNRANRLKSRLQLSPINDNENAEAPTSPAHCGSLDADFDDFDFAIETSPVLPSEASKFTERNKENSPDRPGPTATVTPTAENRQQSSASAGRSVQVRRGPSPLSAINPPQASTSAGSSIQSRSKPSVLASTSRANSTNSSDTGSTPQNSNNYSHFEMNDVSDYHIFSPTKRRAYGRSPLKNIVSLYLHAI